MMGLALIIHYSVTGNPPLYLPSAQQWIVHSAHPVQPCIVSSLRDPDLLWSIKNRPAAPKLIHPRCVWMDPRYPKVTASMLHDFVCKVGR
jgi:hypothetical protein